VVGTSLTFVGCSSKTELKKEASESKNPAEKKVEEKKDTDWPKKSIQIIVPYAAGGDTDFNARIYAKYLEKELGKPVVVVNTTGSGGAIASRKVKDSDPDGYTILMNHSNMVMTQLTGVADFGYEDFEVACVGAMSPGDIITVNAKSPYKTLKDLVELTKNGSENVKSAGTVGSLTQLESLMLNSYGAKLNVVDVGGASERLAALKGGHVQVIPNPYGSIKPYLESGEFRALGYVSEKRNPLVPDIPTCKEQGYDVVVPIPYTFFFPKGTSKEIIEKFSKAVEKIAKTNKEYEQEIAKAYMQTPTYMNSEDAIKLFKSIKENFSKYQDALKAK
jgi:tripartite-type tricarboxylate transporter receptor subunit TctC